MTNPQTAAPGFRRATQSRPKSWPRAKEMSFWCKFVRAAAFVDRKLSASEKTLGDVARKWLRQRREAERKAMA